MEWNVTDRNDDRKQIERGLMLIVLFVGIDLLNYPQNNSTLVNRIHKKTFNPCKESTRKL